MTPPPDPASARANARPAGPLQGTSRSARAYTPARRVLVGALLLVATAAVLELAAELFLDLVAPGEVERVPPPRLVRQLVLFALAPGLGAVLLGWRARAQVEVGAETVTITGRRTGWEIPRASIADVRPWQLGRGVALRLRSGRALHLSLPDPTPLVAALGGRTDHPRLVAARARRATRFLLHPLHALALAPLVPTAILFRLHQIIVYGGWLGEYRWYGLGRWLNTLLGFWLSVAGHMVCWFAVWRLFVALSERPAARLAEPRARAVRWTLEGVAFIGYYGGAAFLLWSRLGA